ncbi:anthrone oxygenase family protein [Ideonella sp. BN130291]|uniref:anthrone oxygenase family protein n=1 Tax=Ideonella sp. BN130291 TaxID=3112940 RepID=UPI002E276FC4|nr:anthrone oxygenase family protein [Ideonella sp. BN130291]
MPSSKLYRLACVAATAWLGLMAGFFFAFAVDVAPAMTHLDATGYVATQQWINRSVRNLTFALAYFGSALLPWVPSALAALQRQWRPAIGWLIVASLYFVAVFWVTRTVNVPINDALAQWLPAAPPADWAAARDRWNEANVWRTVAAMLCFVGALTLTATVGAAKAAR